MTDAEIDSACLSYRHDFGLLSKPEKDRVRFQCREWARAISKARPSPKVRKLVWDGTFYHRKTAHCIIGTYEVCSDRHGVHCLFFEAGESVPHEVSPSCQNMDLAKAAAQADYEARILGALE